MLEWLLYLNIDFICKRSAVVVLRKVKITNNISNESIQNFWCLSFLIDYFDGSDLFF